MARLRGVLPALGLALSCVFLAPDPPATPARAQLGFVLRLMQTGHGTILDVGVHFAPAFLLKTAAQPMLTSLSSLREQDGVPWIDHVEEETARSITAIVAFPSGRRARLALDVAHSGPPLIQDFHLVQAADVDPRLRTEESILAAARALPGASSIAAFDLSGGTCRVLFATDRGRRMAIGSVMKLYVLAAVVDVIREGRLTWASPVAMREEWRSLSPLAARSEAMTVRELGEAMLAASDNTAADHLIGLVGRERVEEKLWALQHEPDRSAPVMTTFEAFSLSLLATADVRAAYEMGDRGQREALLRGLPHGEQERRTMQERLADGEPPAFMTPPIGWFASADDLCRIDLLLRGDAEALRLMRTSRGPRDTDDGVLAAYKAGAARGLLALTWDLERVSDHHPFFVSLIVNDSTDTMDRNDAFYTLSAAATAALRRE